MQVAQTETSSGQAPTNGSSWHLWAKGSFSFHDILDAINPLQHLPIVSTIYREVTGDKIGNAARVAGDSLYGGVIGMAVGLVNALSVSDTGKDLGERAMAMVKGDSEEDKAPDSETNDEGKAPKGTVTVEPVAANSPGISSAQFTAPQISADTALSRDRLPKALSTEAALAALPERPPVDLPFFPGDTSQTNPAGSANTSQPLQTAQTAGLPLPQNAGDAGIKLETQPHGIAIDTTPMGIMAMRAKGHGSAAIPLQVTPGAFLAQNSLNAGNSDPASAVHSSQSMTDSGQKDANGNDFVIRMRQGLDKYKALLAKQNASGMSGENGKAMNVGVGSATSANTVGLLN